MSKLKTSRRRNYVKKLVEENGDICHYCKIELTDDTRTLDHIVPSSHPEGGHKYDNLVLACLDCNNARGNMPYEEFIALDPAVRYAAAAEYNRRVHGPMGHFRGRHWKSSKAKLTHRPFKEIRLKDE